MVLSQTFTTSRHLIQFPVAYLGGPFRKWWLQTVSCFAFHDHWSHMISSIWYSPFPFWLSSFAIASSHCFTSKNSRIDVFVSGTHYFLASHSVSSSLPRRSFSLTMASNCQLFCLSWSLIAYDFIDLILSFTVLTFLVCHSFLTLFYLRNSRADVFVSDTHYFLTSHSASSSLPRRSFSLTIASNCQWFYLSWSLRKLSYANVKESYSRRTTTVIVNVMVLTKVLSFSEETATAITLSNSNNNSNSIKKTL